jgi:hypothetical protein
MAADCIRVQKEAIIRDYPGFEKVVNEFKWVIPEYLLVGGKRKRRTMHRKRSHKKNSSRRNRRVR